MSEESARIGAPSTHNHLLLIDPEEIVFTNVKLKQTYSQSVRITNPLSVPVDFSIRAGSPLRYKLSQTQFHLNGGDSVLVEIRLRVLTHTKPKSLFTSASSSSTSSSSSVVGFPSDAERGIKDIFHIRSEFFTQKFHATWYAWAAPGPNNPNAAQNAANQVAHDLPDSTLSGYEAEGGAAGIREQRRDLAAEKSAKDRATSREAKRLASARDEKEKREREEKAESERKKDLAEAELHKPFERASLQAARKAASVSSLLPPSMQNAANKDAAGSGVSAKEFLALSQAKRSLESELDSKNLEIQQWEFNYNQLEQEYKFACNQMEGMRKTISAQTTPDIQTQLDGLMAAERAGNEKKNQKVLSILLQKDEIIQARSEEVDSLVAQLEELSFAESQANEAREQAEAHCREMERKFSSQISDLTVSLNEARTKVQSLAAGAPQTQQASEMDALVRSLKQKQEQLISERDAVESSNAALKFQLSSLEQSHHELQATHEKLQKKFTAMKEEMDHLNRQDGHSRRLESLEQEVTRKSEQIEDLIRELQAVRHEKPQVAYSTAAAPSISQPSSPSHYHQQQQRDSAASHASLTAYEEEIHDQALLIEDLSKEKEEMSNLIVSQQGEIERLQEEVSRSQSEASNASMHASSLQSRVRSLEEALEDSQAELQQTNSSSNKISIHQSHDIESSSAILAKKQAEVADLRKHNEQLQQSLRDSENQIEKLKQQLHGSSAAATTDSSAAAATSTISAIDSLRAQLLLSESELGSKSHALAMSQLEVRELSARLVQAEEIQSQARVAVQAAEHRSEELSKKVQSLSREKEERIHAQNFIHELQGKIANMERRSDEAARNSSAVENRLEAAAKETEALYQAELSQLKKMLQSMLQQTQNACGAATGSAPPLASSQAPTTSGAASQAVDLSLLHADFTTVLTSLSSLTASRDLHKLSSIRLEKRLQFLEGQLAEFQGLASEASAKLETNKEEHLETLKKAQKKSQEELENAERRFADQTTQLIQVKHALTQSEATVLTLQQSLDEMQSQHTALTAAHKKLNQDLKEQNHKASLKSAEMQEQIHAGSGIINEKNAQIGVLMETIETLQKATFQEERVVPSLTSSGKKSASLSLTEPENASSTAFQTISSKLISFAAQLSHARAQEAILRRTLKSTEAALNRAQSNQSHAEEELWQAVQSTIPGLEKKLAALTATERAARQEVSKSAAKIQKKNEEVFTLNSQLQKSRSANAILTAQIETLQNENKEARKRYIANLSAAQDEHQKALEQFKSSFSRLAQDTQQLGATVTQLKHTASSSSESKSLSGSALVAAVRELSSSISTAVNAIHSAPASAAAAATVSNPTVQAQLFSPFTPKKKVAQFKNKYSLPEPVMPLTASPQFHLHSPSSASTATVAPSTSERAALLPAIFERLLNIVLSNESALLHSEQSAAIAAFQSQRLAATVLAKENENDALRTQYDLYSVQHDKLLHILKQKNDLTQSFLLEQQQAMNAKVENLQNSLFHSQASLLATQSSEAHSDKQVVKLQNEQQRLLRKLALQQSESSQALLLSESQTIKKTEAQWKEKEEELKKYVEQVLRPLIMTNQTEDTDPVPDRDSQIAALTNTITALKLVESQSLLELESSMKLNGILSQQIEDWKAQCAQLQHHVKQIDEKYVDGFPGLIRPPKEKEVEDPYKKLSSSKRSNSAEQEEKYAATAADGESSKGSKKKDKKKRRSSKRRSSSSSSSSSSSPSSSSSSSPSRSHSRSPSRSRSRSRSASVSSSASSQASTRRSSKARGSEKSKSSKSDSSSSSSNKKQSSSSASSSSKKKVRVRAVSPTLELKSLRQQVDYYSQREVELLNALKKSTRIQEQLEDTIEQLIETKKAFEQEAAERERILEIEQEERRQKEEEIKRTSGSTVRATAPTAAASALAAAASSKKKSLTAKGKSKLEASQTSMSNTLAQTVLQVTKQLREKEQATADMQAELTRVTAQLKSHKKEVAALQAQISKSTSELSSAQVNLQAKTAENEVKTSQITQLESAKEKLQTQVTQLEAHTTTLQTQLNTLTSQSTATSSQLTNDLLSLRNELLPSGLENASLKQQLQNLQTQLDHSLQCENAERQRNLELVAGIKQMETERAEISSQYMSSEKAVVVAEDKLQKLRDEYQKDRAMFEAEIKSRENEKIAMKNMLNSLESSRNELHLNHEHVLHEKELKESDYVYRIHELEVSITKELEERNRINRREQDYLDKIQKLEHAKQAVLEDMQLAHSRYEADLAAMKKANELLESTLDQAKNELENLQTIQAEHDVLSAELKALRCQHMEFLSEVNKEREQTGAERAAMESEMRTLHSVIDEKGSQLPRELEHQKALYTDIIHKLKVRIQQLSSEQEESEKDNVELEKKLAHISQLNVTNAQARVKAEEERDLLMLRGEEITRTREAAHQESENKYIVEQQIAAQEFKNLQKNFEEFRRGHESLVAVYQEQHQRLQGRLRKALESVAELQSKKEVKATKVDKKAAKEGGEKATSEKSSASPAFMSEMSKGRLVFDMAELLSSLAEREAVVRSLTAEVEQYKRLLSAQAKEAAEKGEKVPSVARPLTAILASNSSTAHPTLQASQRKKSTSLNGTLAIAGSKDKEPSMTLNLTVDDLAGPPLTWQEERSLAVLGGELAHMEVQLKHAQRQAANEQETALHYEEQLHLAQTSLEATKEKLRATQKELHMLQKHTTGTIKAQEAEIAKISESLRTEEEWAALLKSVTEGKAAVKAAKDDLQRKSKQLHSAHEDILRLKAQLEELEVSNATKESKVTKLNRALASKDTLVNELKRKWEEQEAEDKALSDNTTQLSDKLRAALSQIAKKDVSLKELKAKLDASSHEVALAGEQSAQLDATTASLKRVTKELSTAESKLEEIAAERNLLEKQKAELTTQLELWKTKAQIQTEGQKSDLIALEREATRVGAVYESLKGVMREVALAQVEAIERLSETLMDLERDRGNESIRLDGEISVQDVQQLSLAAEFSKDDLEDIISTTLRGESRPLAKTRSSAYARRLFTEFDTALQGDLSAHTTLSLVRSNLLQLFDERVRMELLVLGAATETEQQQQSKENRPPMASSSTFNYRAAQQPQSSPLKFTTSIHRPTTSTVSNVSAATTAAPIAPLRVSSSHPTELELAAAKVRQLEEELARKELARKSAIVAATSSARFARSRSPSPPAEQKYVRTHQLSTTGSAASRYAHAQIYDRSLKRENSSASISSIDSK